MMTDVQWWYLSFVNTDVAATIPIEQQRPGGPSWLGACYVDVPGDGDLASILARAWELGCNPGGEVQVFGPLPLEGLDAHVPVSMRRRLLTLAEVDEMGGHG